MLRFLGSLGLKSITSQLDRSLFCSFLVLLPLRGLICPAFCARLPPLSPFSSSSSSALGLRPFCPCVCLLCVCAGMWNLFCAQLQVKHSQQGLASRQSRERERERAGGVAGSIHNSRFGLKFLALSWFRLNNYA